MWEESGGLGWKGEGGELSGELSAQICSLVITWLFNPSLLFNP